MTDLVIGADGTLQRGDTMYRVITYTVTGVDFYGASVAAYGASTTDILNNIIIGVTAVDGEEIQIYCELAQAQTENLQTGRTDWFSVEITLADGSKDVLPRIWLQVTP